MINVIGLGYIGLPTALMFSAHGHEVVGTDYNVKIVADLSEGRVTFEEDGLEELFSRAAKNGVSFSTEYQKADVYIISVPTPYDKETKKIDATFVSDAVASVIEICPSDAIIVIESTVSPGTIDKFVRPVVSGSDVHLVHAPERIIPGNMIYELVHNARTIGADDPFVAEKVKQMYASFCKADIATTDIRTAELTKVVENTFRDVNIAFANELARICRKADLDVYEVIRIANMHPRVNILQPGPGVGGHCISVDPWFLVGDFPDTVDVVEAARRVNDSQPGYVLGRIRQIMEENGIDDFARVGFYGLSYKENVDDTRESPTLQMLDMMQEDERRRVNIYDPYVDQELVPGQCRTWSAFVDACDMIVIMVGHDEVCNHIDKLAGKVIYDTRNVCMDFPEVHRL